SSMFSSPILRAFQSNAVLSAFSTASAPPLTQKLYGYSGGVTFVAKAPTKSAINVVYRSEFDGLLTAARCISIKKCGSESDGWLYPIGQLAKHVKKSR